MLLKNNIDPTGHEIGDEIWHTTFPEAEKTAHHFPPTVIRRLGHPQLIGLLAEDMTARLHTIGDTYTAVDGVIYTLAEAPTGQEMSDLHGAATILPVMVTVTGQLFACWRSNSWPSIRQRER